MRLASVSLCEIGPVFCTIIPRQHEILGPDKLAPLTGEGEEAENPANGRMQAATGGEAVPSESDTVQGAQPTAFEEVKDIQ